MLELLDLARCQTGAVGLQLLLNDTHQNVERCDVHNSHRKDRSIREVDYRAKAGGGTDHDKDAKDDLERQLGPLAFTKQVGPGFQPVVGPRDHGRESKQDHRNSQNIGEPADAGAECGGCQGHACVAVNG